MGGELQVKSTPGQGTTFWFELTLPVTMQEQAANGLQMVSHIIGYKGMERKILIVDDNKENRALLKDILSPLGFALMEAGNGQEALHATTQFIPDLILMDIFMPGMNGVEATHHLQQVSGSHTVIGLSASPQTQQGSLAAGCSDFLVKPVQIDQLLTCVGRHLQLEWEYIESEKSRSTSLVMTDAALL
jgi:CheY-like chemotaxis protein